jgi:ketosteroid isomerase-like protein
MTPVLDRFYAALKALSAQDLRACVTDDVVLDWQGTPAIPWAGQWRGVEGLLQFVRRLDANLEILDVQRDHVLQQGGVTVVVLRGHWRTRAAGREVRATAANVFTFAGDRVRTYTVLNNSAAFAEALRG